MAGAKVKKVDLKEPIGNGLVPLDPANIAGSLQRIYEGLIKKADDSISWYQAARRPKKIASSSIRFFAIILFSLAGLVPVLRGMGLSALVPTSLSSVDFGQLGYVFAAVAAAILGLDKFFGLSSGWVRYTLADANIRKLIAEFQMNWIIANTCLEHDEDEQKCAKKRLQLLKDFSTGINDLVNDETRRWPTEFQGSLAALEKASREAQDAARPGTVSVTITKAATITEVTVLLDGQPRQTNAGNSVLLLGVSPGSHQVSATGKKLDGTPVLQSKVVVVTAGATATVELKLE